MTNMAYHWSRAADRVILATESGKTEISVYKGYLQDLSKGKRADQKGYAVLEDKVRADAPELYGIQNLPAEFNPRDFFRSKVELHSQRTFGKSNELKLYTVLTVLSLIAVIVWESGYLNADNDKPEILAKILPCKEATLTMISDLARVNFLALKLLPFDHNIYDDPKEVALIIAV